MLSKTLVLALAVVAVLAADPPCPNLVNIVEINGMTPEARDELLNLHNDFRLQYASGARLPKAGNMKKLVYSESLEQTAQQIINTCSTNPISGLTDANGNFVGQINYASWSSKNNPTQVIKDAFNKWSEEKDCFTYPNLNTKTGKNISSKFLQIINANAASIGCNRLIYTTLSPTTGSTRYNQMIACVYSPTGSSGGVPYELGEGCAELC